MSVEAIGVNLVGRRPSPFALGLRDAAAVESLPGMAKAATQSGARNGGKLTQAQIEARAQQRIEDDELIR
ncbi:MAG: sigma-70 family RNA polymerase sigma factor, partial [Edaphobacter sp.]